MTPTKTQQPSPQIFTTWSDEIKGRIDPYFYSAEIKDFRNKFATVPKQRLLRSVKKIMNKPIRLTQINQNENITHGRRNGRAYNPSFSGCLRTRENMRGKENHKAGDYAYHHSQRF